MDLAPEDWNRMIAVNLSGPFYCSHAVLPYFGKRGGGDIVNVSSLSSTTPFAGGAGYNASKAGLNALSEATMLDHRYDNVRVTQVLPGSTDTDFNGPPQGPRPDWKIAPQDIADAVVMLLRMPRRTTVSRIDVKPTKPPRKPQ
jgi:NADP-dependent 3-hydroxy acid dehydrogenase YdfG